VDKFALKEESKIILNRLEIILSENKKFKLKIGSHTDSRIPKKHNLKLSQKRAQTVVDYLIYKGIGKND
jgi:outer membrane protein OmpA-like peptidoglycan-associated protein